MNLTRILVVEDSKTFNKIIASLLSDYNYSISQAYSLSQAKETISQNNFDFILLDLNLPDSQGNTLLETIKSLTDAKIIVMTGAESNHHRDECFQKGVIDYFIKTTPMKIIASNIHTLIETINNAKNSNILIIDDSSFVRNLLKDVLSEKGYNVYTASSAFEGLDLLQQYNFNLILLDLIMPGLDGISFLEKLKESSIYSKIPVIVISGETSRSKYSRVLKNGASDFIKKPFIIEEVLLKCDIHINNFIQNKKIVESKKEMEKQKSLSKLLGNIAHHWRQPLSAISTNASAILLNKDIQIENEEKEKKRLENIVELTQVLSDTINDFELLFPNLEIKSPINTKEYLDEILKPFKNYIKSNNIKLVKDIKIDNFLGYENKLRQILIILLKNIQEHAKNNKHIFISIENTNKNLEIKIKDSGGGVDKEILKKIFEPYFTSKHQSYGKGLGLFTVYQIIYEGMNGFIDAYNVVFTDEAQTFKGLEFTISIPYKNEKQQ
jgi:DNA-binding response OmpR family regulator